MLNARLRVELFGWLRAHAGSATISRFRTRKTSVLFGYLAYHTERSHPREMLAELLWPDATGAASRNSLSQALSSVRQELGRSGAEVTSLLMADRSSVQLQSRSDVAEFDAALRTDGGRDERIKGLSRAVELYRGELLPGHHDEWILPERSRLRDLFLKATHELVSLLRDAGDLRSAIAIAHRAVREDPFSEEAARDMMAAQLAAHEPHLALRAYQEFAASLLREVGERPAAATRELARRIAAQHAEPSSGLPPVPRTLASGTQTCLLVQVQCGESLPPAWAAALSAIRGSIKNELAKRGATIAQTGAAQFSARFHHPLEALDCAVDLQTSLRHQSWPDGSSLSVGLLLDTFLDGPRRAPASPADDSLRLAPGLRPGSIVLSEATAALVRRDLTPGTRLRELPQLAFAIEHLYALEHVATETPPAVAPLRTAG